MHGGLRALAETEAIKAREAIEAKSSEAGPSDAPVVTVDPGFKKEGADGNEEAKPSSRRKGSMANIFEVVSQSMKENTIHFPPFRYSLADSYHSLKIEDLRES